MKLNVGVLKFYTKLYADAHILHINVYDFK